MNNFVFFVTVPTKKEGERIAEVLIERKLVACVNILNEIQSIYRWKGEVHQDKEFLLLIKTTEEKSDELIKTIEEIHSYETPECIGIRIQKGSKEYLKWINKVVK
jgi:periplasmic divalent cation tolerance protein